MTRSLHIAEDFSLPLDAVTQTFAYLAKRGSGKTYTVAVLMEEMIGCGLPVVALDPVGVLWGLRASADGKGPGLPVVIFGGDHGDVPLESTAGAVVADFCIEARRPVVLDMSLLRKGEQGRFVTDLAERLYHKNREPMHLVLDEADMFAPQRPMPGEQRMLGAIEDIVRRGRARGLGVTLITQRPAVLHKDVLTQVEVLVALRLIAPQDRAAIDAWVKVHGTPEQREELMASLPSLPIGTAWIWSPGWLDVFRRVKIRRRRTFDSSATPTMGTRAAAPAQLAPVDIEQLRTRIASTIEKAKADDPKELRRRIAELERDVTKKAAPAPAKVKRVEVPFISAKQLATLERVGAQFKTLSDKLSTVSEDLLRLVAANAIKVAAVSSIINASRPAERLPARPTASGMARQSSPPDGVLRNGAPRLGAGELVILTATAQHREGVTREQLTVLTGYKRSSRDTYLQRLKAAELVEQRGETIIVTDSGTSTLGPDFEKLPTGADLRKHWLARLPEGERRIFEIVVDAYPKAVTRDLLSDKTGYKRSSRDTYLQRLSARRLIETTRSGEVQGSEELFS